MCSTVKKRWGIYHLSLPLENKVVYVMETIRADFYGDCQDIPDPSALGHRQKNLLLLDDCFLGKQNKAEAYYTISDYLGIRFEKIQTLLSCSHKTRRISHIHADHCANDISLLEFKQFCHGVWSKERNFVTIDLTSTPTNGKYRQNFNRFYFPTGTI